MFGMDNSVLLHWSSLIMIFTGVFTFLSLTFISAPYGRYSTNKGWGFLVPAKLAWFLMESPNLWITGVIFLWTPENDQIVSNANRMLLTCFLTHYVNRAIIFPIGMNECSPMPVSVMFMAFVFCLWNGFNQALSLLVVNKYESDWIMDTRFIVGIALFYAGFFINMRSDSALIKLRRVAAEEAEEASDGKAPTEKKYVIPSGGLFEYVSCANYCESCQLLCLCRCDLFCALISRRDRGVDRLRHRLLVAARCRLRLVHHL